MAPFIARPFTCVDPQREESLGVALTWIADNLRGDVIRPLLWKHGLENFDPDRWYPTQTILNVLKDLHDQPDGDEALIAIGMKSAEAYPFGPEVKSVADAVMAFNAAHHAVHRGIDPEQGFLVDKAAPHTLVVTNNNPWPVELIYGILWTFCSRFSKNGVYKVQPLRDDPHGRAVFRVTWDD